MANLVLAFAELLAGAVVIDAGIKGDTIKNVVTGQATMHPITGSGSGAMTTPASSTSSQTSSEQVTTSQLSKIGSTFGWSGSELAAWLQVIIKESGGNPTATNPSSGAYGIAQFINGPSEYAQYGGNSTSVIGQLTAMANYIHQRYGTPSAAWAHEQTYNWY